MEPGFCGCFFIVLGALVIEAAYGLARRRIPLLLGDASYSIYLTHIPALGVYRNIWNRVVAVEIEPVQISIFMVSSIIFCTICGIIFYSVVEKPLIRVLSKINSPTQ